MAVGIGVGWTVWPCNEPPRRTAEKEAMSSRGLVAKSLRNIPLEVGEGVRLRNTEGKREGGKRERDEGRDREGRERKRERD
jgi:hypothetical protein